MTIATNEALFNQSFIETYKFTIGQNDYYYTSNYEDVLISGINYKAEKVNRTAFAINVVLDPVKCVITIPAANDIANAMKPDKEMLPIKVWIDKRFLNELTTPENLFIGYGKQPQFENGLCSIDFYSISFKLDRQICRVNMQQLCNNTLYDITCGLNEDNFRLNSAITVSNNGKTLTSSQFGLTSLTGGPGGLKNGKVKLIKNGAYRAITNHAGNDITIQPSFIDIVDTDMVSVYQGCDKTGFTCLTKFNNLDNHVGMPYIPLKDPSQTPITN